MSTPADPALTYYPAYAHDAHPLHGTSVPITAATLAGLHQPPSYAGSAVHFHSNHPLRRVALAGVLVAVDETDARWILQLDDGSGALAELVCPRPTVAEQALAAPGQMIRLGPPAWLGRSKSGDDVDMRPSKLGAVVRAEGRLGTFRETMQVLLERIEALRDTQGEVAFWDEVGQAWTDCLSRPWVLDERELLRLRLEAEDDSCAGQERQDCEEPGQKPGDKPLQGEPHDGQGEDESLSAHSDTGDARSSEAGTSDERADLSFSHLSSTAASPAVRETTREAKTNLRKRGVDRRPTYASERSASEELDAALEALGDAAPIPALRAALVQVAWDPAAQPALPLPRDDPEGPPPHRAGPTEETSASQELDAALEARAGAADPPLRAALAEAAWNRPARRVTMRAREPPTAPPAAPPRPRSRCGRSPEAQSASQKLDAALEARDGPPDAALRAALVEAAWARPARPRQ